jgi:hypothetical protein
MDTARAEERRAALAELRKRDTERLNTYAVIDRAGDSFQMPIERAMELVVREYAGTSPRALPLPPVPESSPSASPVATP